MRIAVIVVAIVMVSSPSHASPSCMTKSEARQKLGTAHLYWHGTGHCWDANPGRRRLAQRAKPKEPRQVEREARPERKPPRWTQERRWREAIGTAAVARLINRIDHPKVPQRKILVETELIEGATVAPPPARWHPGAGIGI